MPQEPNNWCEVAGQQCFMNYCDENGCQDRKRVYTPFGLSLLHNEDLLKHGEGVEVGSEEWADYVAELTSRNLL